MLDNKTRLNATIRNHIVKRALETSGVDAADKKLIEDRAAFAEKVRQMCLAKFGFTDESLRAIYEEMAARDTDEKLSEFVQLGVYTNYRDFQVNINGQTRVLYLNGAHSRWSLTHIPEDETVEKGGRLCPRNKVNFADNDLADEINEMDQRATANANRRTEVEKTVTSAIGKVGTVGKLLEAWPAAKELLPESYVSDKSKALALNPATLNALCGIPSEEDAQ